MDIQDAQEVWKKIQSGDHAESDPGFFTDSIADSFMDSYSSGEQPDLAYIDLLCELAAGSDNSLADAAMWSLYNRIVEPLCDEFTSRGVRVCNEVLLSILVFIRKAPTGRKMNALLDEQGFVTNESFLIRFRRLLTRPSLDASFVAGVKKIIILSRITIGSDIAITGVMVHRLRRSFSQAELVLIGPRHMKEVFEGVPGVRCIEVLYKRHGNLFERVIMWPALFSLVQKEKKGLSPGELLLFDPDTRMTQLGLLPLVDEEYTCYCNTRNDYPEAPEMSLPALVNRWLDGLLPEKSMQYPAVAFSEAKSRNASLFCNRLKKNGSFVITVNLGVGRNDEKRISGSFEEKLISGLLQEENTIVLLDSGSSPSGRRRADSLLGIVGTEGVQTDFVYEKELPEKEISFSHGVVGFKGSIGAIGSLIGESDAFFGYDSCCQHLACATETPSVVVFAGAPNQRFRYRWRPHNAKDTTRVIHVDRRPEESEKKIIKLVERVVEEIDKIRKGEGPWSK
ncbi:MAG: hypothetical protein KAK02_09245 [Desulfobulbaceae bacterium]|nr:hypothetical protein [Desulfobulbaceae bacterium]